MSASTRSPDAAPVPLRLKKKEDRRLRQGHLWVYSNEVDTATTPLKGMSPGQAVSIIGADGRFVAYGYANPATLICARVLSRDEKRPVDQALLNARVEAALALREGWFEAPYYRLIYGEADALPGLIVDRYGDWLVGQITTAGMELLREPLEQALYAATSARGLLWRNDTDARTLEGLEHYHQVAWGADEHNAPAAEAGADEAAPQAVSEQVTIVENGLQFQVSIGGGQKTGWFFDQRDNRALLARWVRAQVAAQKPPRVLDVCSYSGGFGLNAAAAGAQHVLCMDSSQPALDAVEVNAGLNQVSVKTRREDAFDGLRALAGENKQFDAVVLDPPAFIKRKRDMSAGRRAYQRLNELAMGVLAPGGLLVTCSCSFHLSDSELLGLVQAAAARRGRTLQLLHVGSPAPDHPVHPMIEQSRYLCALFLRVLPAD